MSEDIEQLRQRLEQAKEVIESLRTDQCDAVAGLRGAALLRLRETEENLSERERRFCVLVESMPQFVWETDADGRTTYVNRAWQNYTGLSVEQTQDEGWSHCYHPDDLAALIAARRRTLKTGEQYCVEARIRRSADGEYRWFEARAAAVYDASGRISGWVGTCTDIHDRKMGAKAKSEDSERLRLAVEGGELGTWHRDEVAGTVDWNDRMYQLLGRDPSRSTITLDTFLEYVHPDDRAFVRESLSALKAHGETTKTEFRIVRDDGRLRWLASAGKVYRDEAGRPLRVCGVNYDITDRKVAEQEALAHREASEREQRVLESVMNGAVNVHLAYLDRDFNFVRVNRTYAEGCGYRPDELIGKNHFALFPHPENEAIFARARDTGILAEFHDKPFTYPNHPKRSITYWDWTLTPVKNADGEVDGFVLALVETTRRKQTEDALRQAESRYHVLFDSIDEGFCVIEVLFDESNVPVDYRFLEVNRAFERQTGLSNAVGKTMRELVPEHEQHWFDTYGHVALTGEPARFENRAEQLDRWYDVYAFRYGTSDQRQVAVLFRDVSQRIRTEDKLRETMDQLEHRIAARTAELQQRSKQLARLASELTLAEQRERQRIAGVLHDRLQQLLVAASMHVDLIRTSEDSPDRHTLDLVHRVLGEAIDESRTLSRELSPQMLKHRGLVPAFQWLANWMSDNYGLAVDVNITDEVSIGREDVRVLLFESVRELLFNTVKHAEVDRAELQVTRTDHDLAVTVSDRGAGFDPRAATEDADAVGLGLVSIRERTNLLGGRMDVDSAPGRGSQFTLTLPLDVLDEPSMDDKGREPEAEASQPRGPRPSKTPREHDLYENHVRVVLADDHTVVRDGLKLLLEAQSDIEIVGEASNGVEAVELARKLEPDVILMDANMPVMDGPEATRRIRMALPHVRIVGLSMHEQNDAGAAAMRDAGATEFLSKSGESSVLLRVVRGKE